ncbi:MAG: hypothetical protein HYY12_06285 [Candidatus Methylomirabilis oxyfera]|nr:hypothetical protein [Candidatus Methylomirabilis oxyfera]
MYTREPYVPVTLLEAQLEALYDRLPPPEKLLRLVKLEIEVGTAVHFVQEEGEWGPQASTVTIIEKHRT